MKIKRFHARTMRDALQQVREEQGPDSVILSKQRVADGIEVIAAVDYDEALLHQTNLQFGRRATGTADMRSVSAAGNQVDPASAGQAQTTAQPESSDSPGSTGSERTLSNFFTRAYANTGRLSTAETEPGQHAAGPVSDEESSGGARSVPESRTGTDFRSLFDAAATIATLPEPGQGPQPIDTATLDSLSSQISSLKESLGHQLTELRWDELQRQQPKLAEVIRRLDLLGLERPLVQQIVRSLSPHDEQKKAWRNAIGLLAKRIPIAAQDVCDEGGIFAVVGPTGSGKTTSIAKLAARFALEHDCRQIGLITTDSYRIGAQEHLLRIGKILGVPVQVAGTPEILRATLDQLADKKLILIDTAGFNLKNESMLTRLEDLTQHSPTVQTLLTLPANLQTASLRQAIGAFDRLGLDGAIVTKVDEATCLGGLLSVVIQSNLTLCYVTDGQRVPEDLKPASRYRADFVSQAVALAREYAADTRHPERPSGVPTTRAAPEPERDQPPLTTTNDNRIASYG